MCEAVFLSKRSKKNLYVPSLSKEVSGNRENQKHSDQKAVVLDFAAKQAIAS